MKKISKCIDIKLIRIKNAFLGSLSHNYIYFLGVGRMMEVGLFIKSRFIELFKEFNIIIVSSFY